MSTVSKLDRNVRIDRYLRKEQRREMQKDLGTIGMIIAQGKKILHGKEFKRYTNAAQFKHERLLQEMVVRETVMKLVLRQITKICLDPARTGERKEEILAKLMAEPQAPEPGLIERVT